MFAMLPLMLAGPDLRRPLPVPGFPAPGLAARALATPGAAPAAAAGCHLRPSLSRSRLQGSWGGWSPLVLVAALLVMAFALAPEAPQDQAAICQRHNGPAACRVW